MRFVKFFLYIIPFCSVGIVPAFAEESPSKTQILYIRHGEVPGNDPSPSTYIYTGCGTDDSLTEKGRAQAEKCAQTISNLQESGAIGKITAIYASDLKRARETAAPIAEELGLDVVLRSSLREINWDVRMDSSCKKWERSGEQRKKR